MNLATVMSMRPTRWSILGFLLVAAISAEAADVRRYALADHGALTLAVPDGWRDKVESPGPNLPPTITFFPASSRGFQVLVTPIWPFKADIPKPSPESVRESVRRAADSVKSQVVEPELKIEEFKGPETYASFFSATDRAPKPGEYKYMTQGMMGLDDLRVTFTILTNEGRNDIVPRALNMLMDARRERGGGLAR